MELSYIVIAQPPEFGYFAVCIERYISAQGRTISEALDRLRISYKAELDESAKRFPDGGPFEGIPPAPKKYQTMNEFGIGLLDAGVICNHGRTIESRA